jgi:hypothetical protein
MTDEQRELLLKAQQSLAIDTTYNCSSRWWMGSRLRGWVVWARDGDGGKPNPQPLPWEGRGAGFFGVFSSWGCGVLFNLGKVAAGRGAWCACHGRQRA